MKKYDNPSLDWLLCVCFFSQFRSEFFFLLNFLVVVEWNLQMRWDSDEAVDESEEKIINKNNQVNSILVLYVFV
jgi:hypothetical protein